MEGKPSVMSESALTVVAAFEMAYGHWLEEQNRQISELRTALQDQISDLELRFLVDGGMSHYFEPFSMKRKAAEADILYVMSGMWKTSAERVFWWIGGFRPSELLKVLLPQLYPLAEQQHLYVSSLTQSCHKQKMLFRKVWIQLQLTVAQTLAADPPGEGIYFPRMAIVMEKLEAVVSFVNQADHLRQETLQQMSRILTIRQTARGLLALGEYFQRLRALSTLWKNRPVVETKTTCKSRL